MSYKELHTEEKEETVKVVWHNVECTCDTCGKIVPFQTKYGQKIRYMVPDLWGKVGVDLYCEACYKEWEKKREFREYNDLRDTLLGIQNLLQGAITASTTLKDMQRTMNEVQELLWDYTGE